MFWRQTIVRLRAPLAPDESGARRAKRDWARARHLTITGCSVQPAVGSEEDQDTLGAVVTERLRIYAPAGTDIAVTDRVFFEGRTYEVDKPAQKQVSISGNIDHVEVTVRRADA